MRIFLGMVIAFLILGMPTTVLAQPCEPTIDCNANGVADSCDITQNVSDDCNLNGVPDECDLLALTSSDCDSNGIPDECEPVTTSLIIGGTSTGDSVMSSEWMLVTDPAEPPPADEPPPPPGEIEPAILRLVEAYKRVGTRWVLDGYLIPNDPTDQDNLDGFGMSMAISGDTAVVGAPMKNGDKGAVYIFQRTEFGWNNVQVLESQLPVFGDQYGASVDMMGTDIVIGAPHAPLGADGDDPPDNVATPGGYIELWSQTGTGWERTERLTTSNPVLGGGEEIGTSVAFASGGWVFAGAPGSALSGTVIGWRTFGNGYVPLELLSPFDATQGHSFGTQLSWSGDTLVVGADRAPGLNGPVGAVYTYSRSETGNEWNAGTRTSSPSPASNGYASSLDMNGDLMIVGEPRVDAARGFAHLYHRSATGGWDLMESLRPLATANGNAVGSAVATNGEWVFYNAPEIFANAEFREIEPDCNANGQDDRCEIDSGLFGDCNGNNIIDSCDISSGFSTDCDGNGVPDACELATGATDCNNNGVIDSCDLNSQQSTDCNSNGIPDECDSDCDQNGIPDGCDLLAGAADCNANGQIDSCDIASGSSSDCDGNGAPDSCDLLSGAGDCNANGIIDSCEIATTSGDCDNDGLLDACQLVNQPHLDCNGNFELDVCDLSAGLSNDCESDGIPDECQLSTGSSADCNGNGIPDHCEPEGEVDTIPPIFVTTVSNITKSTDPNSCSALVGWLTPIAEDACDSAPLVSADHLNGSAFNLGTTTVTVTAEDNYGNSTTSTFTVTVVDDQAPTMTGLPDSFVMSNDAGDCGALVTWAEPAFEDNCLTVLSSSDIQNTSFLATGTHTVTYTGTDAAGLSVSGSFDIVINDDEKPEIVNPPQDVTLNTSTDECGAIVSWDAVQTTDNCDILSVTSTRNSGEFFEKGTTSVTILVADTSNNQVSHTFTVTVIDAQAPTMSGLSGPIVVQNDSGLCGATVSWDAPLTFDNCPGEMLSSNHDPDSYFEVGDHTVTYTVMDTSGLSVTGSFDITVNDNESPVFNTAPASQTLEALDGQCSTPAMWDLPTISDNCEVLTLESTYLSGHEFEVGTTTVLMTLTDNHMNASTHEFDITVTDTQSPVINNISGNLSVENDLDSCGAFVFWDEPTATDNCPGVTISGDEPSGQFFAIGTTHTVTYTAVDAYGATVSDSFDIVVSDTQNPEFISAPTGIAMTSDLGVCGAQVFWEAPIYSDNCAIMSQASTHQSGEVFPIGTTEVTMTLLDVSLNSSAYSFEVTVLDNEAPTLSGMPTEISVSSQPGQCSAFVSWDEPRPLDNCAEVTMTSSIANGSEFELGSALVTYTATDASNNSYQESFLVTVTDEENPEFVDAPASVTIDSLPGQCSALAAWADPVVGDNCGDTTLSVSHASGSNFNVGSTFVTMFLSDSSGNTVQHAFTVTVVDTESPVLSGIPMDMNLNSDTGECGATANWALPQGSDNCGLGDLLGSHQPGQFFPTGSTTVSYSQADSNGNLATGSFVVTVQDTEAPVITTSGNIDINAPEAICAAELTVPVPAVSDNCDVAEITNDINGGGPVSGVFEFGVTVINWTATDSAGNNSTVQQTVTVSVPRDDCDNSGTPDVCDIASGIASDCNGNGIPDSCDLLTGVSEDCNSSGVPDSCEVAAGSAQDCDGNGTPDECDSDCNGNGSPDACDVNSGSSLDCNGNGTPDECDLSSGSSQDSNGNDTPDDCEAKFRRGDANEDETVDIADAIFMLYTLMLGGPESGCADATDANDSGSHDIADIIFVLNYQFTNGAPPASPGVESCGVDGTPDDGLGCDQYGGCP